MIAVRALMNPAAQAPQAELRLGLRRAIRAVRVHIRRGVGLVQKSIEFLAVMHTRVGHVVLPDHLVLGIRVHVILVAVETLAVLLGPAPNRFPGSHCGKRSGCWNPERGHCLADDVLAQHRPKRRTSVAAPGIRRRASALELDVAAHAGAVDHLAQKNGASITELRDESPELVASISHGERLASLGHPVTREDLHTRRLEWMRL